MPELADSSSTSKARPITAACLRSSAVSSSSRSTRRSITSRTLSGSATPSRHVDPPAAAVLVEDERARLRQATQDLAHEEGVAIRL